MMIKHYIKQVGNLMRQEKLFSSIYIIGTGLSIALVMVLSITYYIKIGNIYPETNRDRLLIITSAKERSLTSEDGSSGGLSEHFIKTYLTPIENAEAVSIIYSDYDTDGHFIELPQNQEQLEIGVKYVNTSFWTVFPFRFLEGKPFSEADFKSGIRTAVVSESLAKKVFGNTDAIGKYISMNHNSYRITGVVRDVSSLMTRTHAHVWVPYTTAEGYNATFGETGLLGHHAAYILAPSKKELKAIKEEVLLTIQKINTKLKDKDWELTLNGQPDTQWQSIFRNYSNVSVDFTKIGIQYSLIFLILLLIPAISLAGMTDSRMERRLAEMGIRRSFGAPSKTLLLQIFSENFIFTLLGGIVGLIASYLLIILNKDWIMDIGQRFVDSPLNDGSTTFTPSMLINLPVFAIAFLVCLILNFFSTLLPAWKYSRKDIIHSLNIK